jgi:hypothetical protein
MVSEEMGVRHNNKNKTRYRSFHKILKIDSVFKNGNKKRERIREEFF